MLNTHLENNDNRIMEIQPHSKLFLMNLFIEWILTKLFPFLSKIFARSIRMFAIKNQIHFNSVFIITEKEIVVK